MRRYLFLLTSVFLISCQTATFQQHRADGFNDFYRAQQALSESSFYQVFTGTAKIYIYGDDKRFVEARDRMMGLYSGSAPASDIDAFTVYGPSFETPEIHIKGRDVGGKIYINEAGLGHEVFHLIHAANPDRFVDPDKDVWSLVK